MESEMQKLTTFWRNNRGFIVFVSLMLMFRSAVADWYEVPSGSMQPTIQIGDRILVDKMAYDLRLPFSSVSLKKQADPRQGDIVVFVSKVADNRLVKRVIGVPGDVVAMHNNVLTINGKQVSYVNSDSVYEAADTAVLVEQLSQISHQVKLAAYSGVQNSFAAVRVPQGHYLVLGDNRDNSADSRVIGFVPRDEIIGRASKVLYSLNYENYYLPRSERFLASL